MKYLSLYKIQQSKIAKLVLVFSLSLLSVLAIPLTAQARYETYQGTTYYEGNRIGPIGQEVDSTGWSAAHLIWQVSQWYTINPQVVLATMQKESSLITSSNPPFYLPMWAMGYAYTDSGIKPVCVTSTNNNPTGSCAGFAMQVDWAAGSLSSWQTAAVNGTASVYKKDSPLTLYSYALQANQTITPRSGGTAALYRYTPYITTPNTFCNIFNNTFGWSTGQDCTNPENVINDDVFTNKNTMSEADIQNFLVAHGSYLATYTVPPDNITSIYRFYDVKNGSHFYTSSESEKNSIIVKWPTIYHYEGVAYAINNSNPNNSAPLYRFYNKQNGSHFYTASENEKSTVIAKWPSIYNYEGVAFYVSNTPDNSSNVYRFYNKQNGSHFYTASENEKSTVIARWSSTYNYEGIAFYIGN